MEILLEELYKTDISLEKFHFRKLFLEDKSYQINGITQSGKTKVVKNYLLGLKKSSYLYIDCNDLRIEKAKLNEILQDFCTKYTINTLVLDNYTPEIRIVNIPQIIFCCEIHYEIDFLTTMRLYPLDYEEFLSYEHKYDSTALNHFFKLGGFPSMHKISSDDRVLYLQKILKNALSTIELDILIFCAKMMAQKISPYSIYERLKQTQKISKDKLYAAFEALSAKGYIHQLCKVNHPKAVRKIYLCDISLKSALTTEKQFSKLFENMIYLELLKSGKELFYDDGVDFYLPSHEEIILGMPFADERTLFKKMENIEAFLFTYQIKKVTVVTMSTEGSMSHPLSEVEMVPFDIWALGD
ncbi:MAG: ATP-binding protein [Sulfurimonas sp.]|uniref:ATP-binding protein n=1 Tax=Sulfurimonas sp. TaxID=2022749 RepID=UPI00260E05B9|nr:ATP-binding protein [Sulfurimonas sp.]MDD2652053.1 ATP-binding protein [Sulfurimonas sp.]MDD3452038.1 ATP-binding protein [Sulfurimonas sp.]